MQKYFYLFLPVLFSVTAQLLIKQAAQNELRSTAWTLAMAGSIIAYILAFIFYSICVRFFPVSLASPVNTILVMLLVVLGGVIIWEEPWGFQRTTGILLGVISMILLLSSK